jgi:hypothetical protein
MIRRDQKWQHGVLVFEGWRRCCERARRVKLSQLQMSIKSAARKAQARCCRSKSKQLVSIPSVNEYGFSDASAHESQDEQQ